MVHYYYHAHLVVSHKPDVYTGPLIQLVEDAVRRHKGSTSRAVNFGCGPGHTSFLLTKTFEKVKELQFRARGHAG